MIKNNYLWYIILLYIGSVLFIFWLPNKKDSFTNKKNIILLGDSLLNNSNYVKTGNSIENILKSMLDHSITLLSFAEDGSTIEDVFNQLNQIPLHFNSSDNYIFLSAGGNDILNTDFAQLNINTIFDKYSTLINTIVTKFPYINIISLTLYYPINIKYEKYKDVITIWNEKMKKLMGNNTILLTNIIRSPEDIVNNIEPSLIGGQKISNAILQKIGI